MVEGLHPVVLAFGDGRLDRASLLGVHDEAFSALGGDYDLADRHPALTVLGPRFEFEHGRRISLYVKLI